MTKKRVAGWLLGTLLLAATVAVAAPEDRFKGADKDGYDKQDAGTLISLNYVWGGMVGGGYDGSANGMAADVAVVFPTGTVLRIK